MSAGVTLEITHRFPVPRARLFRSWSDPELFKRWFMYDWGERAELDFRVGGAYRITGHLPSGTPVECRGVYTAIEAPERIALTFDWIGTPDDPHSCTPEPGPTPVAAEFREVDGGSELLFRQEGIVDEQSLAGHRQGWTGCFELVGRLLT